MYIPFSISPGREISNIDLKHRIKIGDYEVGFEKLENYYALTIGPFASEEQATQYFPKIKSALLWVSLKYMIGFSFSSELSDIKLMDAPKLIPEKGPVKDIAKFTGWDATDGYYDADKSVIRPDHKRLTRWETGSATVITGLGANNFVQGIAEAISFPHLEKIQGDSKLQLAIELYSSFFFEQSTEAKFIKLVTVLEALTPGYNALGVSESAINDAKNNIKAQRNQHKQDSEEWKELDQLLSRLGQLKQKSIGVSLRIYVSKVIDENPALGEKSDVINKLKDLYNHRSKLLHEGSSDKNAIQEGLHFLTGFVPRLLEVLYRAESV